MEAGVLSDQTLFFTFKHVYLATLNSQTCPKFTLNLTHLIINEIQSLFLLYNWQASSLNHSYLEIWTVSFSGAAGE